MSFNAPADFTKKMLWGPLPIMTLRMMLSRRHANQWPVQYAVGRYYMRLVLPVIAMFVFMGPASRPIAARTIECS